MKDVTKTSAVHQMTISVQNVALTPIQRGWITVVELVPLICVVHQSQGVQTPHSAQTIRCLILIISVVRFQTGIVILQSMKEMINAAFRRTHALQPVHAFLGRKVGNARSRDAQLCVTILEFGMARKMCM